MLLAGSLPGFLFLRNFLATSVAVFRNRDF